jgi:DNA-binding PadR family transcriptional regulator
MPRQPDTLQGALDLLVLKTLQRGANHGFGITLHIQTVSEGALRVEEGSLYPALRRLERDKLIKGEWQVTENGRRAPLPPDARRREAARRRGRELVRPDGERRKDPEVRMRGILRRLFRRSALDAESREEMRRTWRCAPSPTRSRA